MKWDVVVVDNDPAASAENAVNGLRTAFFVPITFVVEPHAGAASARNRGLTEARGDIIAFIDDDVIPEQNWLRELVAPILEGRCQGTGGRVVLEPGVERPTWFDEETIGGYLSRFDLGQNTQLIHSDGYVLTANAAFLCDPLRATGGFDDRLGPRGNTHLVCDDNLITQRLIAAGARIVYVPTAVVTHELAPTRLTPRYLIQRAYAQGRSDWRLMQVLGKLTRFCGLRVAWQHLELPVRRRGALSGRRAEAFHVLTDVARSAGVLRELLHSFVHDAQPTPESNPETHIRNTHSRGLTT